MEPNWAWIAGLFEGEGSIDINGNKVTLRIQMVDHDVLTKLNEMVPSPSGLKRTIRTDNGNCQPIYRWHLCSKEPVTIMLEAILPHMGQRRSARIHEALDALALNRGVTRTGPKDRPPRRNPDGSMNPDYDRWRYRQRQEVAV